MSFGPESHNPRERRAYAHSAISRARTTGTLDDFSAAQQAVVGAGNSRKTLASQFDRHLAGIQRLRQAESETTGQRQEPVVFHTPDADITVQQVTEVDGELMAAAADGKWVRLGALTPTGRATKFTFNSFLHQLRVSLTQVHLLTWEGNKIPRGAEINSQQIAWTQNGIVTSIEGEMIGQYERLQEFEGENRKTQQMLVFTEPPTDSTR